MTMTILDLAFEDIGNLTPDRLEKTRTAESGSLIVNSEEPAHEVISRAEATEVCAILVTDEHNRVRGIVFPKWVNHTLREHAGIQSPTLTQSVSQLAQLIKNKKAREVIKRLTYDRPERYWCEGGQHYTDSCPCPVKRHRGSKCTKEEL